MQRELWKQCQAQPTYQPATHRPCLVMRRPHQLKQAKLEAMQLKIKERLSANIKPPPPDPYMGLETAWVGRAMPCCMQRTCAPQVLHTGRLHMMFCCPLPLLQNPEDEQSGYSPFGTCTQQMQQLSPCLTCCSSTSVTHINMRLHHITQFARLCCSHFKSLFAAPDNGESGRMRPGGLEQYQVRDCVLVP